MSRVATILLAALMLASGGANASAQPPSVRIPRVAEPPIIQRYLDGGDVPPGIAVSGFRQREPGDGVPASQPTTAYLSYDATHFYVVFVCKDDPGKVRANLTRREAFGGDDMVGVIIDPYHDGRRAYLFLTNPLGIQMDGVAAEGQEDDYTYDTLWQSEGRLTSDGYVVVLGIPFKSLRFSNESIQTWGIAVVRSVTRENETSFWPYITRRISGFGSQLAALEGIEGVSPGRNLQAIPYGTFAAARFLDDDGARVNDTVGRAGIDAKAVIKDALTVDLTINPDFSQVESDEPQVTINQRFEVFFPEKRPFFIENAGYFETPQNLFFSRRIADPTVGGRVTGRSQGWALGALLTSDEQPGRAVPDDDPRRDVLAGIGVLRLQRQFARQSYVGGIFTDREFGSSFNRVYGVDGRWKLDENWAITGQWVASGTRGVVGPTTDGTSFGGVVSREGRSFDYSSSYLARSPQFRADLGFIPRVDMQESEHEIGYTWHPQNSPVLSVGPDLEVNVLWDYGGTLQEWTVEPGFEIELPRQTEIGVRYWRWFERFEGLEFRHSSAMVYLQSEWLSWLAAGALYNWGTGINYYPAEGLAPFLADSQEVEAGLTLRPTSRLRIDESYLFSRLALDDEADVFNNHILRTRANYQVSRELTSRVIVDYEAVLPNESLVSLTREKRLTLDILFTYLVNPWTALYVGYTDGYENLIVASPLDRPPVRGGGPTTSVGRQVFVKLSYLFRF